MKFPVLAWISTIFSITNCVFIWAIDCLDVVLEIG